MGRIGTTIASVAAALLALGWWMTRGPASESRSRAEGGEYQVERSSSPSERTQVDTPRGSERPASMNAVASPRESSRRAATLFEQRRSAYELAADLDASQLEGRLREALAQPAGEQRNAAIEPLLLRYSETDPDAALRLAIAEQSPAAEHMISILARVDPNRAIAALELESPSSRRSRLLGIALRELARTTPQQAVEIAGRVGDEERRALQAAALHEWAKVDAAQAASWVEQSKDPAMRSQTIFAVGDEYVLRDPAAALAWAERISRSSERFLWGRMLGVLSQSRPEEALQIALGTARGDQRRNALREIVSTAAQRDPQLASGMLQRIERESERAAVTSAVSVALAGISPQRALEFSEAQQGERMRSAALSGVGRALAVTDPETAAQYLDRLPLPVRREWINMIAVGYASTNPDKGVQFIAEHGRDQPAARRAFVSNLAMRDAPRAIEMVLAMEVSSERDNLLTQTLAQLADESPEQAADVLPQIRDPARRDNAAAQVAQRWAYNDPAAAMKWVSSIPAGPRRDTALASYAASVRDTDRAIEAIGDISSEQTRMDAVFASALRMRSDPDGVRRLLRRFPLDPQRSAQLEQIQRNAKFSE